MPHQYPARDAAIRGFRADRVLRAPWSAAGRDVRGPRGAVGLVLADLVAALQREADVVEAVQQAVVRVIVQVERLVEVDCRHRHPPVHHVDHDLDRRVVLDDAHDARDHVLRHLDGHEPDLEAVVPEDVGEARGDDGTKAVVLEGPHRVLTRGARPEVRARDEDLRLPEAVLVEHEVRPLAPFREEALAEPRALDALQPVARDDLVRVDVGAVERDTAGDDLAYGLHQARSSGVVKRPATAVAAATAGDTRCVRPPLTWRPSKWRL